MKKFFRFSIFTFCKFWTVTYSMNFGLVKYFMPLAINSWLFINRLLNEKNCSF